MSPVTDDPAPRNNEQKRGVDILNDPRLNKGTAFTPEERDGSY